MSERRCRCSGTATACGWEALLSPTSALLSRRCDSGRMTAWRDVEQAEPGFAQRVRRLFDAHRHKTIATLRADGSPRISGIEAAFEDGELAFGSMPNARKGADLRRDPRFALHSATIDPVESSEAQWPGEAKIARRGDLSRADHRGTRWRPLLRRYRSKLVHRRLCQTDRRDVPSCREACVVPKDHRASRGCPSGNAQRTPGGVRAPGRRRPAQKLSH
jgi:Pyridoxamine 5'-phosphate oxidase